MTINDRIAIAKGWTYGEELRISSRKMGYVPTHWCNPEGKPAMRPDFTGTLEGATGMLRELQEAQHRKKKALRRRPDVYLHWSWRYVPQEKVYDCDLRNQSGYRHRVFESPVDRPGHCVGEAYMSVFGKEADDDGKRETRNRCDAAYDF